MVDADGGGGSEAVVVWMEGVWGPIVTTVMVTPVS